MGWTVGYRSPGRILDEFREWAEAGFTRTTDMVSIDITITDIVTTERGMHIWAVERVNGVPSDILLRLIERRPTDEARETPIYAVKALAASEHPYYYDCPKRLLGLFYGDALRGLPLEWRLAVYAYHERRAEEREARQRMRTVKA